MTENHRPDTADHHASKTYQIKPDVASSSQNAKDHQRRGGEKKHWKTEEWFRRASFILSAVVAMATVCALVFAALAWVETHRQAVEAHRQADAALATSRLWVTVDVSLSEALRNDSAGIHISVDGIVHNVGHSPALMVKDALFAVVGQTSLASAKRTCETLSDVPFANIGRVLFAEDVDKASSGQFPMKTHLTFASSALHAVPSRQDDDLVLSGVACVVYDSRVATQYNASSASAMRPFDQVGILI